jgi:hypothetical protein
MRGQVLALAALLPFAYGALFDNAFTHMGAQGVNLWRLQQAHKQRVAAGKLTVQDPSAVAPAFTKPKHDEFQEQWFEQPLDHFTEGSETWKQRFWANTRHYNATRGGPVFVLDGGETSGENRLPFLDTGIMDILARATGGIGVVLEHRYYGESNPSSFSANMSLIGIFLSGNSLPVKNFTTDSLRFLNNDQSAADSALFMERANFAGVDNDITAPGTPWIYYGGSYAGARAAHMRVLYPEIVYGAIASSGEELPLHVVRGGSLILHSSKAVTHAFIEYWEYMDTIRISADQSCMARLESAISHIDAILATGNRFAIRTLKSLFGVQDLEHDEDFASLISVRSSHQFEYIPTISY